MIRRGSYPTAALVSLSSEVTSRLKALAAQDGGLPEEVATELVLAQLPDAVAKAIERRVAAALPEDGPARLQAQAD